MTELKRICPFCGGEMIGSGTLPICHYNPSCVICDREVPQELLDLLADTKKKLDICVSALNSIVDYGKIACSELQKNALGQFQKPVSKMQDIAHLAVKQINQKEEK